MKNIFKIILTVILITNHQSLVTLKAQVGNTKLGTNAAPNLVAGDSTVAIGINAAKTLGSGSRGVYLGANAGYSNSLSDDVRINFQK